MIFFGHFSAHFPQFVHFAGSICAILLTTLIASSSHTLTHNLHPIHPTEHAPLHPYLYPENYSLPNVSDHMVLTR